MGRLILFMCCLLCVGCDTKIKNEQLDSIWYGIRLKGVDIYKLQDEVHSLEKELGYKYVKTVYDEDDDEPNFRPAHHEKVEEKIGVVVYGGDAIEKAPTLYYDKKNFTIMLDGKCLGNKEVKGKITTYKLVNCK